MTDTIHNQNPAPIPRVRYSRFDRLTLFGRRWYFNFVGRNNEILVQSEGYSSAAARDKTLFMIRDHANLSKEKV